MLMKKKLATEDLLHCEHRSKLLFAKYF